MKGCATAQRGLERPLGIQRGAVFAARFDSLRPRQDRPDIRSLCGKNVLKLRGLKTRFFKREAARVSAKAA